MKNNYTIVKERVIYKPNERESSKRALSPEYGTKVLDLWIKDQCKSSGVIC